LARKIYPRRRKPGRDRPEGDEGASEDKPAAASVMVVVEGGLVQNVISDRPAVVLVKDFD
jgi:hypothetical protein